MQVRSGTRRILVTGGAGFIGSHLVRALRRRNHHVRILDDLTSGRRDNLPPDAELLVGDILNGDLVRQAIQDVDVVFHLAAIASVSESARNWRRAHAVNLGGALEVFQAAADGHRPRVVFASSAAVYGEPERLPLSENSPTAPVSQYGADKLGCEQQARVLASGRGLEWVGLRLFNVYGPGQDPASPYSGVITTFLDRASAGRDLRVFGSGEQSRDFVFVDDAIACFLWAMDEDGLDSRIFNVSTGRGTSINRLAELILSLRPGSQTLVHDSPRPGDISQSVGDNAKLARSGGPVPTMRLRRGLESMLAAPQGDGQG